MGGVICCVITLLGIILFKWFVTIQHLPLSMVASGSPLPVWLIFFALGVSAAQGMLPSMKIRTLIIILFVSIILCFVECLITHKYFDSWNHGIKPTSHLYSFFVVLLVFQNKSKILYGKIKETIIDKFICYVGRVSFFVYLTHMLILMIGGRLLPSVWIIKWSVMIILSIAFAYVTDKVTSIKLKKYIGF